MSFIHPVLSSILMLVLATSFASALPFIFWHSDPVLPGETLVLSGSLLKATTSASICLNSSQTGCFPATIVEQSDAALKLAVNASLPLSLYSVRLCENSNCAFLDLMVNKAEVWWTLGDRGDSSTPGGWFRLFGRSLSFDEASCIPSSIPVPCSRTRVTFKSVSNGNTLTLGEGGEVMATCHDLYVRIPESMAFGNYNVLVSNSLQLPQNLATSLTRNGSSITLTVTSPQIWNSTIYDVRSAYNGSVVAALQDAAKAGGGTVFVSAGPDLIMTTDVLIPAGVTLTGDSPSPSRLVWPTITPLPWYQDGIVGGSATEWRLQNIGLVVNSPITRTFIYVGPAGKYSGSRIDNVAIYMNTSAFPSTPIGHALWIESAEVEVSNLNVVHVGYCETQWPQAAALFIDGGDYPDYIRIMNSYFDYSCQAFVEFGGNNILFENTTWYTEGKMGNGFNTFGRTAAMERLAFVRNHMQATDSNIFRYEMMTPDNPGAFYNGTIAAVIDPLMIRLASIPPGEAIPWNSYDHGAALAVLNGTGVGQVARVVNFVKDTLTLTLAAPFLQPLDDTSYVTFIHYRGDNVIAGNSFYNGTQVQLYGCAFYSVFADNDFRYMWEAEQFIGGLHLWSLIYQGGLQPNFYVEMTRNYLLSSQYIYVYGRGFDAPLLRDLVIRGNYFYNTSIILDYPALINILIEGNTFSNLGDVKIQWINQNGGPMNYIALNNTERNLTSPYLPEASYECPSRPPAATSPASTFSTFWLSTYTLVLAAYYETI